MTEPEAADIIQRLIDIFPSVATYYSANRNTLRQTWLQTLQRCNHGYAVAVVEDLACGDMILPPNYEYDRLAIVIRKEAGDREANQTQRQAQYRKYFATNGAMEFVRKDKTGSIAVELGDMVRRKEITREENDRYMTELMTYDKGGDEPEFLSRLFTK